MLFLTALLLCLAVSAWAEPARVMTPGGKLNMRKTSDEKGKLVDSVPNKALVEATDIGEEWTKITYKKQSGYVKTEFLKLASQLAGKTVYPDQGGVLIYRAPGEPALAGIVGGLESVSVQTVTDGWAYVETEQAKGYVDVTALSFQWEEPQGTLDWITEKGVLTEDCSLFVSADEKNGEAVARLSQGQAVQVTAIEGDMCLILYEAGCGYVPVSSVCLSGPADTDHRLDGLSPMEAANAAETALKKKFKAYANERLYCLVDVCESVNGLRGPVYYCGFLDDQDQYRYGALVTPGDAKAVFLASYVRFAVPQAQGNDLPAGELHLELSTDSLSVGDVLDIRVNAWTAYRASYDLYKGDTQLVSGEPGMHFQAAYRPRAAGNYRLVVTVADERGLSASDEKTFTVDDEYVNAGLSEIYSQRDGWWADKKYRHSNLGKSGCAIFALSHALQRLGFDDASVMPENLATRYAYCLIKEEGTNNTLLINTAARHYGFKTQTKLIDDPKKIIDLLQGGAYFSFSPARGHIAMVSGVSEDKTMLSIVDSAPGATFERIKNAALYYQLRSGSFRAALSLDELPGARWYLDTGEYGGLEYWLPMSYVVTRGVRMIQPLEQ